MKWPWIKNRADVAEANRRARVAARQAELSASRRRAAELQAARAQTVSAALRREVDRNGWTELLQDAWGGKR